MSLVGFCPVTCLKILYMNSWIAGMKTVYGVLSCWHICSYFRVTCFTKKPGHAEKIANVTARRVDTELGCCSLDKYWASAVSKTWSTRKPWFLWSHYRPVIHNEFIARKVSLYGNTQYTAIKTKSYFENKVSPMAVWWGWEIEMESCQNPQSKCLMKLDVRWKWSLLRLSRLAFLT